MKHCLTCGSELGPLEVCAKCLLQTGLSADGQSLAERLFQAALSLDPTERKSFVASNTQGNEALEEEVKLLLEGYAETGGDNAIPTLGAGNARSQWSVAQREEPGTLIDHFRLVKCIGQGGMGTVWEADQLEPMQRKVALKIIKLGMDTEEVVKRFDRERRTLALMKHPHIAQVFEAGATLSGRPYFAMELAEGEAITSFAEHKQLKVGERLVLFLQVCDAVEHAHQKGVIHRDLKPSNILVTEGEAKVIDFGVAKAVRASTDALLTRHAQVLGTPAYMAPEQAETDGADVDTRSDVYSLGVVLYELLCGALPFDPQRLASTGVREIQRILREEQPKPPSSRISSFGPRPEQSVKQLELRGDLDWIVMKAMSKERDRRYASAAAFGEDVRRYLSGDVVNAVPPTWAYRTEKFVRKHRAGVAALSAVLVAMAGGLLVSLLQIQKTNRALEGEARARNEALATVADLYTRNGLTAAKDHEGMRAALWFAKAATVAPEDAERTRSNQMRHAAWRQENHKAVRAWSPGIGPVGALLWNPTGKALVAQSYGDARAVILDVDNETLWRPESEFPMEIARWSHDGARMISVHAGVVRIVEFPSGRHVASCACTGTVWALAVSPDDRCIAVGGEQGFLWEPARDTKRSLPLTQGTAPATNLEFSAGRQLLLVSSPVHAGVCDIDAPGQYLFPPLLHPPRLGAPHFLGNEEAFFTLDAARAVMVIAARSGQPLESYLGATGVDGVPAIASPDGKFIACTDAPLIERRGPRRTIPSHKNRFTVSSFSPDGKRMLSLCADGALQSWRLDRDAPGELVGRHQESVTAASYSPDGKWVASSQDLTGLTRIWQLAEPPQPKEIRVNVPSSFKLSQDFRLIIPSGQPFQAWPMTATRVHDLKSAEPVGPELQVNGAIVDAEFAPDGAWVALAVATTPDRKNLNFAKSAGTGNLQIWNWKTGQRLGEPVNLPAEPRGIAVHPGGHWIACYDAKRDLMEMNVEERGIRMLRSTNETFGTGDVKSNGRCRYSPDGKILVAWGMRRRGLIWNHETQLEAVQTPANFVAQDVDFHGDLLACVTIQSELHFLSLPSCEPVMPALTGDGNWLFAGKFNAAGDRFLSAGRSTLAHVREWRENRLISPAMQHDGEVFAGAFINGTSTIVTGGLDMKLSFWDQNTGLAIRPPLNQGTAVLDLAITPDAQALVRGDTESGALAIYHVPSLLPTMNLPPNEALQLAEIDAGAEITLGGLVPFSGSEWMAKWREFRKHHPTFNAK